MKKKLDAVWDDVKVKVHETVPRPYSKSLQSTRREVVGASVAGLSAVTVAETLQWIVGLMPGDFLLPTRPALFFATLIGVWYARTFRGN